MQTEETRRQVLALYSAWPSRKSFGEAGATAFFAWLKNDPIWSAGDFGDGSKFQIIAEWIAQWESVAGEIERMHDQRLAARELDMRLQRVSELANGGSN